MWGRRGPADAAATKEAAKAERQRALSAVEDLLRRAEWEGLSEAERATLLSAYATLDMSGPHSASPMSGRAADVVFQEWVAKLVAPRFQEEVAAVVRGWLDAASPDSHLFVGGSAGQGRRSLVASLARQAMAQRPAPPEYCYVPQPAAMDRPMILELPSGAGKAFTKALQEALNTVGQEPDSDDHTDENAARAARTQQVAATFDALAGTAPAQAGDYLTQLRAAIETALASDDGLPFANGDAPIWYAVSNSADAASDRAGSGAPVVLASLVQTELVDALLRANGGVLVLSAADLLLVNGAWPTLFSALAARALPLKDGWPSLPLAVRVVAVGPGDAYRGLLESSDDFSRLFRYEVWTNPLVDWTRETEAAYACLADGVTRRYALPAFDLSGVARLIEEGARRAFNLNRTHLTTDLLLLHDLVVEAGRAAQGRSATVTTGG
ncbi:MAG TPA: AAA family ATPase, partial [Ktedonobacterales bacterium]